MESAKKPCGRPFQIGNLGRKPLANSLTGEQGEELLRKAVEMAMSGNVAMMKFLLDRVLPKERLVQLELPRLDYADDSVDAMAEIVNAVSSGRISPREAADVAQLVSAFTRAIDQTDAQMEIDSMKSMVDEYRVKLNMDRSGPNSKKS